jgi:hypothetical protein
MFDFIEYIKRSVIWADAGHPIQFRSNINWLGVWKLRIEVSGEWTGIQWERASQRIYCLHDVGGVTLKIGILTESCRLNAKEGVVAVGEYLSSGLESVYLQANMEVQHDRG